MRLCANMPSQHAVATALGGRQSIEDLVLPGGRILEQRDTAYELLTQIPGVTCVKPKGALYLFPRLDPKVYKIKDDRADGARPAAGREDHGGARDGLQLAGAGSLPDRDAARRPRTSRTR